MSDDAVLGLANTGDAYAIAAMSRDLIETGLGWEYRRERVARMIADPDLIALVARQTPRLAGFALMSVTDERAHIALLAVRPAHQRLGVARRMLAWLTASAQAAGVATMHVELRAGNEPAYALYRACGFEETLRIPGYYLGREAAVRMLLVLRPLHAAMPAWEPPARDIQ
ncbi:MAG: GNAT family N-acetyltransferase [Burkholderiales bacterium]